MTRLIVDQVRVRRAGRVVTDQVSFVAEPGTITVLVGPNGSGKSTLLAAIAGDLAVERGQICFDQLSADELRPLQAARLRAVLTQNHEVVFDFHAEAVVALARQPWRGKSSAEADQSIIARAMDDTDSTAFCGRGVMSLSGGERSRVQLARVLAQTTPVLLLDEPSAALDLRHQSMALERARAAAADGATVVVVLHDLDAAFAIADQVVVLDRGRVRTVGTPDQISASLLSEVYDHPVFTLRHPVTDRLLVVPARAGETAAVR